MEEISARGYAQAILKELIKAGLMNGQTNHDQKQGERHADYLRTLHQELTKYYQSLP